MKTAAYATAAFLVSFAGGTVFRLGGGAEGRAPAVRTEWDVSRFHPTKQHLPDDYDVVFRLRFPDARAVARAVFSLGADGSYYYAELSPKRLALGKAGLWREAELDSASVELDAAREHRFSIVRRKGLVALVADGELQCLLRDDDLSGGELRLGGSSGKILFSGVRVRPAESEIAFGDDFMRAEDEQSTWKELRGEWRTLSLRSPLLSANAFSYEARGEESLALAGSRTWAEYDFEASMQGPPDGRLGIVFAAQGPKDHVLFSWGARPEGRKELYVVKDGGAELVASAPGGYVPGVWYRARAEVNVGRARVLLDGREAFDFSSAALAGGEIGLWADSLDAALFDDILVTTRKDFDDSFAAPLGARWRLLGGEWKAGEPVRADAPEGAKALWGGGSYRDVEIRSGFRGGSGEAGLVIAYRDELNYILCSRPLSRGRSELVLVEEGRRRVLDELDCPGGPGELSVSMKRGHVLCRLPSGTLEGYSEKFREGRVGLWARGSGLAFGGFALSHHEHPPQILGRNSIFGEEREMSRWADPAGDWYVGRSTKVGSPWWNRGLFPGDCEAMLGVRKEPKGAFDVALSVSKSGTGAGKRYNGYVFKVFADANSGGGAELYRDGEKAASGDARLDEPLRTLSLRRAGRYAVGAVNGREVLVFRDSRPPSGSKVAWVAKGVEAVAADAMVFSERVWDYDFSRAPCDWRRGTGIWEVTNRWECDQRWSFYSGRPERGRKLAVLWNKRSFRGDVSVEFYACIKMEGARGRRYSWARDVNVTVCADGSDLTSGYSFIFGGFDNTKTCIVRKGKVVASTDSGLIPRTNRAHRAWFYLRVEKRGPHVEFKVDNGRVASLEYEDPEPLAGDKVAIWTYDCGIMVSRVRVSASDGGGCEEVEFTPDDARCLYDE